MGQSSSRHAAPSRVSFRTSTRTVSYDPTRQYAQSDDDLASEHDAPSWRRRTISHRAELQSNNSTSRHQRTSSAYAAPPGDRIEQRAPQTPKTSSRRSHTTPDRSYHYEKTWAADRSYDCEPRSPTTRSKSEASLPVPRRRRSRPKKECVVCTESRSLSHFPYEPPTARCAHDVDVCRRCLRTWISTSFSSKTWDDVNCPICAERLSIDDIREFAPSGIYRQYKWFHTKAELEALPGWHWCISEGCKSGQQIARGTSKFKCVRCKQAHCVEHNVPWHKRKSCKQYEQRFAYVLFPGMI